MLLTSMPAAGTMLSFLRTVISSASVDSTLNPRCIVVYWLTMLPRVSATNMVATVGASFSCMIPEWVT